MATIAAEISSIGIPPAQLLGFALTIAASYFSARWGSAESRKQFRKKNEDEERVAAANLIPLLMKFASDYEKKIGNLSSFVASDGREGIDEPMTGIDFDPAIHLNAARLGSQVTARAIKLAVTKTRAEQHVGDVSGFYDTNDLNRMILSFSYLLALRARYLVDMAAEKADLAMRHSEDEIERLRMPAFEYAHEIDSADETKWH